MLTQVAQLHNCFVSIEHRIIEYIHNTVLLYATQISSQCPDSQPVPYMDPFLFVLLANNTNNYHNNANHYQK